MAESQNSEGWAVVESSLLRAGTVLGCDLFRGNQILLRSGTEINESFLETLRKQNIEFVRVSGVEAEKLKQERMLHGLKNQMSAGHNNMAVYGPLTGGAYFEGAIVDKEAHLYKKAYITPALDRELLNHVIDIVRKSYHEVRMHGGFDPDPLRAPVRELVLEAVAHPTAALKLLDVKHYIDYTVTHSVNVALLFIALIRSHIPKDKIMEMTMGALMHDIGKARIPSEIIEKRSELTEAEFQIMKSHPVIGFKILTTKCGFSLDSAEIAFYHHERWNGKGYPKGIDKFGLSIQIASLCDVYDALTTTRSYRTKIDFYSALSIVIKESGSGFSPLAVKLLIERIGLFPIGSFVILNNGRIGVVYEINTNDMYKPKVCVLYDTPNDPVDPPYLADLAVNLSLSIARTLTLDEVMRLTV